MVRGQHASLAEDGAECALCQGEEAFTPNDEQLAQKYAEGRTAGGGCSSEERVAKLKDVVGTGETKGLCWQDDFNLEKPAQPDLKSICLCLCSGWKKVTHEANRHAEAAIDTSREYLETRLSCRPPGGDTGWLGRERTRIGHRP